MTRQQERSVGIVLLFVLAGLLVVLGMKGWRVYFIPTQYLGILIAAISVAGLAGVNIWHKTPLDPADDHKEDAGKDDPPKVT